MTTKESSQVQSNSRPSNGRVSAFKPTRSEQQTEQQASSPLDEVLFESNKTVAETPESRALAYWKNELAGAPARFELPTGKPRPAVRSLRGATEFFELSTELLESLKSLSQQEQTTLFMTLGAGFMALLRGYSGQDDILVGTRACGNTVVLRAQFNDTLNFRTLLQQVRERVVGAYAHQDLPFEQLVAELVPERDPSYAPLVQVMFLLNNGEANLGETGTSKFDLTLSLTETQGGLDGSIEYSTDLFDADTIRCLCGHWTTLLEGVVRDPEMPLSDLPLLTRAEERQFLIEWNNTDRAIPNVTVHQLFEQQVERTPDAIAVESDGRRLSYRELNWSANRLAWRLREAGVGPDTLVALCVERSVEMVAALLAIHKAGGAYLPLDPAFPEDRLAFLIEDAQAPFLLTDPTVHGSLPQTSARVIYCEEGTGGGDNLAPASTPDNLAYLLYTSGSTGRPKGVEISLRAMVNLLRSVQRKPGFTSTDSLLAIATLSFDIAGAEIFLPLISGGRLVVASRDDARDPEQLMKRLRESCCSVFQATPVTWRALVEAGWTGSHNLRAFSTGEALPQDLAQQLLSRCGELWNLYGPTETTIWSTIHHVTSADGPIPIGKAIDNTEVYILDANRKLVPVGCTGELYIAGVGLGRGYLRRPDLTHERFVPHPFSQVGARAYRTGDLARWLPDGAIECLGRIDNQLKIRGFRIEPGEIEAALREQPGVRDAVVLAREDEPGNKQLVAYLAPEWADIPDQQALAPLALRKHLSARLPHYMIPSAFVLMEKLPLTPNGKLDRNALPSPSFNDVAADQEFVAPRTKTEKALAAIWSEVLKVERIGIHDDFFKLGGHSLNAIRAVARIRDVFEVDLPTQTVFTHATIAALAEALEKRGGMRSSSSMALPQVQADPANRYRPFPLNHIQQAYLIGRSDVVELGNIPCRPYYEMEVEDWNRERFETALDKMIERHEMLRCIVLPDGDQQILAKVPKYEVQTRDLRALNPAAAAAWLEATREEMIRTVPATDEWPLFEFRASRLDGRRTRLHVRIDLLIADGRSLEILFTELAQFYRNPEIVLPALDLSFRDYLSALDAAEQTTAFQESQKYWMERVPSLPPAPEIPLAKNPATIEKPVFKRRSARIDAGTWRNLREKGARFRVTPSGILLAAYAEVLAIWSKSPRFTLNLTLFNRLPLHPQANDIIGDFTSLNLLEADISTQDSFVQRARRQQEQLWQDIDHRLFSGIQVMRELRRLQGVGPKAIMPIVFTSLLNLDDCGEGTTWLSRLGEPGFAHTQTPQVYLDFIVQEDKGTLILNWDAVDELFAEGMLDDMFQSLQRLLRELASDEASWDRSLADNTRELLPPEQMEMRKQANATEAPVSDELLHTPFLKQVAERPEQLAICTPTRRLTYTETYQLACRIERELLDRGVEPNQMVGVLMAKGWEQIVAVLGIHFAGGAYLPIDSELPVERQRYLMENGAVKVVLIQSELRPRLDVPEGVAVLAVDTMEPLESVAPVARGRQKPEDLAYIIYTSGSTGLPKGVMIDHRGAVNTVLDINRRFGIGPRDRVLALSRLNFDLSVYDIFGLLAAGGAIVMPAPELAQDPSHWAELIVSEKVTVWNTVPALMQLMTEEASRNSGAGIGSTLRLIMMSGDWIPVNLPGQIQRVLPEARIISLGGATEASIWSILYPIEKVDPGWKSVPYGKPMLNQTFQVLNQALAPSPVWVPGQLYIGGIGVAKGYFGDQQKTNASFIQHPVSGERLYRTGDLGRYLPDGNIEFLGREDFQVKIQGYRIELGEIEVRLQEYPGVDNCAVTVREDNPGEKRLVGYAVPQAGAQLEASQVREYLRAKLPEYMIPSAFVFLDRFPLTANGKVDRKVLPAPVRAKTESGATRTSPGDFLEAQLTHLWEKMLGVHPVGPNDNFFELGGTSMMAVRLFSELRKRFGKSLSLSTLFQAPTVEKIAELLRNSGYTSSWSSLVPIQPGGHKPPFYCVHGAGGNVLMFRELAERMAPDIPFYGLQAQGLDGSRKYLKSVEEMAACYLKEIRQFQPEGPYYLGGFCLGGQVAFEMAQLLRQEGEKVALLAVIDTYNFHGERLNLSLRESISHAREKVAFHFLNVIRLDLKQQLKYLFKKLQGAYIRESDKLVVRASNLIGNRHHGREISDVLLERLNEDAHFAYIAAPYDGNTIMFKAKKNYSYLHDPMLGWGDVLTGPLEFIELPSNPGGLFMDPYVQTLAEKLTEKIDEATAFNRSGTLSHASAVSRGDETEQAKNEMASA